MDKLQKIFGILADVIENKYLTPKQAYDIVKKIVATVRTISLDDIDPEDVRAMAKKMKDDAITDDQKHDADLDDKFNKP
jgi:hypothetical protein